MHRFSFLTAALLLVIPAVVAAITASSVCYFPDGTLATSDYPCFPGQPESICCGFNHTCMSNNLCRWPDDSMQPDLSYIRGSCTDKSWKSGDCSSQCQNADPSQWNPIHECTPGENCCETSGDCCSPASIAVSPLFKIPSATTVTVIGAKGYSSTNVAMSTVSTAASISAMPTKGSNSSSTVSTPVLTQTPTGITQSSGAKGLVRRGQRPWFGIVVVTGVFVALV